MNVVAAVVADIGNMSFLHLCCVPLREARAEPGATTGLDFGRGCDFALEKGGSLLSGLRRQGGGRSRCESRQTRRKGQKRFSHARGIHAPQERPHSARLRREGSRKPRSEKEPGLFCGGGAANYFRLKTRRTVSTACMVYSGLAASWKRSFMKEMGS